MIGYGKQSISKTDLMAVERVLKSDWFTQGPEILAFEAEFANYVGAKYAVAVSNGTAALQLIARTLKYLYPNIINTPVNVPDITFVADASSFKNEGFNINLVDIDFPNPHPKFNQAGIIVPVDMCGIPYVPNVTNKHEFIIRDGCHSLGAQWRTEGGNWNRVGDCSWADFTVFSFHPVKHITTGEGGMITTNNLEWCNILKKFRNHGFEFRDNKYELDYPGFNFRMSDIQAALGRSQLKRINEFVNRRIELANMYTEAFESIDEIITPKWNTATQLPSWHLYTLLTYKRDALRKYLLTHGIGTQIHYQPISDYKAYQCDTKFPDSRLWYEQAVSIPMYPDLTNAEVRGIIEHIKDFIKG